VFQLGCCQVALQLCRRRDIVAAQIKERQMKTQLILVGCGVLALTVSGAHAGPCDTVGKSTQLRDAGSGPTPGNIVQQHETTGSADSSQQPPTSAMSRATGTGAASSEDAQKQMQGQPTAAEQAQGAKPSGQRADKDC
jgi:hypothetical protein